MRVWRTGVRALVVVAFLATSCVWVSPALAETAERDARRAEVERRLSEEPSEDDRSVSAEREQRRQDRVGARDAGPTDDEATETPGGPDETPVEDRTARDARAAGEPAVAEQHAGTPAPTAPPETDPGATPASATAAQASPGSVDTKITVEYDGTDTGPPTHPNVKWMAGDTFVPTGTCMPGYARLPGDDCFFNDRIVRTLDVTLFKIQWTVDPANSGSGAIPTGNVGLTVNVAGGAVIPEGWVGLACGGFSSTSTSFTCSSLGSRFTTSTTGAFLLPVVAPMSMGDGAKFHATSSITETGGVPSLGSASDQSDVVTTSARPRFELVKEGVRVVPSSGPAGTSGPGQRQDWAIGIRGGAQGYTDVRGLSALTGTVTLRDQVTAPGALPEWFHSCGTETLPGWPNQVPGPLSNPDSQLRPPQVVCPLPLLGGPSPVSITVQLSGIDWGRAAIVESPPGTYRPAPTPVSGLPSGRLGLVAYFRLSTWTSDADLDAFTAPAGDDTGSAVVCNTVETSGPGQAGAGGGTIRPWVPAGAVSTWAPVDASGLPNFGGVLEPVANNGACLFKEVPVPDPERVDAYYVKAPISPGTNGAAVLDGGTAKSLVRFVNNGNVPYPAGAVLCDKWDNSLFDMAAVNAFATFGTAGVDYTVDYATGNWGAPGPPSGPAWFRQATSDCSAMAAAPGSWAPLLPSSAPPAGANMVRVTTMSPIPVGGYFEIQPDWTMHASLPPGQEFRNYSAAFLPHRGPSGEWQTSNCPIDPLLPLSCRAGLALGESAGNNSHWWTNMAGTVAVDKERVGPINVEAGSTTTWRVRVRAIPGPGPTRQVKLRDVLPPGFTYLGPTVSAAGSFALSPPEPTCTPAGAPQTCEWAPIDVPFQQDIDITFQVAIDPFTPPGLYTNLAEAETPDNPTPFGHPGLDPRRDTDQVRILTATRAHIDKSALPSPARPGDTLTFTLRYGNPSSTAVNSMDATDLLPFSGDPRGSTFASGSFTLTGINPSATGGEDVWVSGESPASLDMLDGVADGYLDPSSAGPLSGPRWCRLADVATAACPQIPSLGSVTAVRFVGSAGPAGQPFLPAGSRFHEITIAYEVGACTLGDSISNSWIARFEGLFFPVRFPAQAVGVAGCVPGLEVVKEVSDADGQWVESATLPEDSDVTWRITVTNTGGTPLSGLTISDPVVAACETAGAAAAPATLMPGESFTFTCTEPGVTSGHINTVTVSALDPDGNVVDGADDARVEITRRPDVGAPPVVTPVTTSVLEPAARFGPLALSGASLQRLIRFGLLAVGLGLVAVLTTTRRRRARRPAPG